jgi:putative oxygen-independent coproporphyrinogen III oxidase
MLPLSLYIHLPWCIKKCPYCDFNSHTQKGSLPETLYINQLIRDLEADLPWVKQRKIHSIFFGGGTPSLFKPSSFEKLLKEINQKIPFENDIEITLEANPGTVEQSKFDGFFQAGINRLSIGCQSFQDEKLKALGRIHGSAEAIRAISAAQNAGFKNLNIDLMFGLPGQTPEDAQNDLKQAVALNPSHISWYQLTLEPNTYFSHNPPILPEEDSLWEMQQTGQAYLQQQGFLQYEISAYAKNQEYCQHNLNYWLFGDYLGIGAGAHGKLTLLQPNLNLLRTVKLKNPKDYLAASEFRQSQDLIEKNQLPFEFMLNALRLNQPISLSLFETRTGLSSDLLADKIAIAVQKKLLENKPGWLIKTSLGARFLNDLISLFLDFSL